MDMLFFPDNKPWGEASSRGTVAEGEASRSAPCDPPCCGGCTAPRQAAAAPLPRAALVWPPWKAGHGDILFSREDNAPFPIRFHLRAHLQLSRNCPLLSQLKPSFCRQKAVYCQINNAAARRAGSGQHRDMELRVRIITGVYHISGGYYIKGMLPCTKAAAGI